MSIHVSMHMAMHISTDSLRTIVAKGQPRFDIDGIVGFGYGRELPSAVGKAVNSQRDIQREELRADRIAQPSTDRAAMGPASLFRPWHEYLAALAAVAPVSRTQ